LVFARFVNPQCIGPFDSSMGDRKLRRKKNMDPPEVQSDKGPPVMARMPRTKKATVHRTKGGRDPVQSARRQVTPEAIEMNVSIIRQIAQTTEKLGPLIAMASTIAAAFDKPNLEGAPTRVILQPGMNMAQVDRPDQAMPLSLYQTSYLAADPTLLPDGKHWTMKDIAMTPAIAGLQTFTSITDNPLIIDMPHGAPGTPFDVVKNLHTLSRGSTRVMIQFFCSAFISTRFIIVWSDLSQASASNVSTDNNITRVIDVKGDTTVNFTFPFLFHSLIIWNSI